MSAEQNFLHPPSVEPVRYARNFIKTAVCELRFPAVLELEAKPPRAFQSKIRKLYPFYDTQFIDQIDSDQVAREHRYLFRSKDKNWTVTVKSFAIALETKKYTDFEEFLERLTTIIECANEMIDADFFTRVGLRYINSVPLKTWDATGWIRPELLSSFAALPLGSPSTLACVVAGDMENGKYTVRHGFKIDDDPRKTPDGPQYNLDFDYYAENLEAQAVYDRLKEFNKTNFALFNWCLGDNAKQLLGPGKPK